MSSFVDRRITSVSNRVGCTHSLARSCSTLLYFEISTSESRPGASSGRAIKSRGRVPSVTYRGETEDIDVSKQTSASLVRYQFSESFSHSSKFLPSFLVILFVQDDIVDVMDYEAQLFVSNQPVGLHHTLQSSKCGPSRRERLESNDEDSKCLVLEKS